MSSNQNILVKLNEAGLRINNKWLVKDVSIQIEKGKIAVSYTHLTLPTIA